MPMGRERIGPTWQTTYSIWLANSERFAEDEKRLNFEYFPPGVEEGRSPFEAAIRPDGLVKRCTIQS